jgi:hypothetical protein
MYTLEERDGALYAKETSINEWLPRQDENWYLLATPYRNFVSWFASEEAARQLLGMEIRATINNPAVVFRNHLGWLFHRADASSKPAYTESTPIPSPKIKGRCKVVWHKGAWHKETVKGLVKVA